MSETTVKNDKSLEMLTDQLFKSGAHFGLSKSRRHPSTKNYVFGVKNNLEIFDLEKTRELLLNAEKFVSSIAAAGEQILIIGSKKEALEVIRNVASSINQPYVAGRWIGGVITNFTEIKKRVEKMERLQTERAKGELAKYTKWEQMQIDKEILHLESLFGGIVSMKKLPKAMIVVDPKKEIAAVLEARKAHIPVIAIANTDCDVSDIEYPVLGNDSSRTSINLFLKRLATAYSSTPVEKKEAPQA